MSASPSIKLARYGRPLAFAAIGVAMVGALLGLFDATRALATPALAASVGLVGVAAFVLRARPGPASPEDEDTQWRRRIALNASSLILLVIFLLLALVELLTIPAALGQLVVFSSLGLGFVTYYPLLLAALLCALAGAAIISAPIPAPGPNKAARALASMSGALTALFGVFALIVAVGGLGPLGVKPERSVFVLAAALVTLYFLVKSCLNLPSYGEVSAWLEEDERLKASGMLRKLALGLLVLSGVGILLSLLPIFPGIPREIGFVGAGLGMLALLAATFNVGVSHVVPRLEFGDANTLDDRRKRRVILSAISIALSGLAVGLAILTAFAFLAQAGSVAIFRSLLQAYVDFDLAIFGFVLAALVAAVYVRTRVKTDVAYTEKLKAIAIGTALLSIVLVFFGVFIGSGLAEGSGIQIENAVLVMGAAVIVLIQFVKARTALPSVLGLMREAISTSAEADTDTRQTIHNRMITTYIVGLLFVLGFVAFVVATTLHVIPSPQASLGTDLAFFAYMMGGIALLVIVVMRYFQSVNIDQRWAKQAAEESSIGKKRLTSEEVKRYLILGFSAGTATLLVFLGVLVFMGLMKSLGPVHLDKKYATDFFVFAILIGLGPYGWYQSREAKRVEAIDAKFPEFLRDLAESQRAGMTLTEAVKVAAKGQYGPLTGEIRKMAVQIEWGVSFGDALTRFSERVKTPLINRTVSLVIQASNAGGNVVDVLTAAADDAREIQQIVKERKQSMSIYVMIIYIAFAVFVGVIAVLNAQFIPEVAKAVTKADGVSIGGLHFKKFNEDDFKTLFFHAAIIQGFGGGIVGGVMAGGKPVHGIRHSFILVLIAWVLFRLIIR